MSPRLQSWGGAHSGQWVAPSLGALVRLVRTYTVRAVGTPMLVVIIQLGDKCTSCGRELLKQQVLHVTYRMGHPAKPGLRSVDLDCQCAFNLLLRVLPDALPLFFGAIVPVVSDVVSCLVSP